MITGAVILDYWGIIKADIGIRDGRIVAIGKAGNPDTMHGVHPDLVVGPSTEVIAGNGRIITAGAHRLPRASDLPADHGRSARRRHHHARSAGGTGPAEGSKATTVTARRLAPGPAAGVTRRVAVEHRAARKGQHRQRRIAVGATARRRVAVSSCTRTGGRPPLRSTRA